MTIMQLWSETPLLASGMELLIKITLLLGIALVAHWLLRHAQPALRRAIWSATVPLVLLLPVLNGALPNIPLASDLLVQSTPTLNSTTTPNSTKNTEALPAQPIVEPSAGEHQAPGTGSIQSFPNQNTSAANNSSDIPTTSHSNFWPNIILAALIGIWLLGALVGGYRLLRGGLYTRQLRRGAKPLEVSSILTSLNTIDRKQLPGIYCSEQVPTPMAVGIVSPVILLPSSSRHWQENKLRAVLLHELAHVRGSDNLFRFLMLMACSLYWFHPLIWIAYNRLKEEQERTADNFVIHHGVGATSYARHLLDIVKSIQGQPCYQGATTMMGNSAFLPRRMQSLLTTNPSAKRLNRGHVSVLVLAALALTLILAIVTTQPLALAADDEATAESTNNTNPQQQTFQSLQDDYSQAYTAGDVEKLLTFYTDDAIVVSVGEKHQGKTAIGNYLREQVSNGFALESRVKSVRIDGDTAVEDGTYEVTTPGGFDLSGKYRVNWQRRDGQWKIVRDHTFMPDLGGIGSVVSEAMKEVGRAMDNIDWDEEFNPGKDTPLHSAAEAGHVDIVKMLLEKGAEVDAAGRRGRTPLYLAAEAGNLKIVKVLLKAGADPNQADHRGTTALHEASEAGHTAIVSLLLDNGADVNITTK